MSSLFANDVWYLSVDGKVYVLDFMSVPGRAKLIYDTESLLSPIVKLNKVGASQVMANTLDNQVIMLCGQTNKILSQSILKLTVNCFGMLKASRLGLAFVGLGNANQF
jgi:hypothetical protein